MLLLYDFLIEDKKKSMRNKNSYFLFQRELGIKNNLFIYLKEIR